MDALTTLMNFWNAFVIYGHPKSDSIKKYVICFRLAAIMTAHIKPINFFFTETQNEFLQEYAKN